MKKYIIYAVAIVAVLAIGYCILPNRPSSNVKGLETPTYFNSVTNKGVLCGVTGSSTLLLASNPSREYFHVVNISSNAIVLTFGATTSSPYNGAYVAASSTFEMNPSTSVYTGNVYCQVLTGTTASTTVFSMP